MTDGLDKAALSRRIIDSATDSAIIATDAQGQVLRWSVGAERILGWTAEEMIGQTLARSFKPEDHAIDRMATEMRSAVDHGAGNDERYHLRKDGERFWANGELTPLRDEGGALFGFVKVLRDRTEQRAAFEALRDEKATNDRLLDSMPEGFYAVDSTGVTTRCNRAFLNMMGFAREEDVIGLRLHNIIHHSHIDGSPRAVEDCPIYVCARVGTRAHVLDDVFFPVIGPSLPVEYWANPIVRDGRVEGAICTFLDISDRKAAERAQRASEARLRALNADLEHQVITRSGERALTWSVTSDLLSVIDLTSETFESVNPSWEAALGWAETKMVGRPFAAFLHPDDDTASAEAFERVRRGDPVLKFENRYRSKLGSWKWLSWVSVPYNGKLYSRAA